MQCLLAVLHWILLSSNSLSLRALPPRQTADVRPVRRRLPSSHDAFEAQTWCQIRVWRAKIFLTLIAGLYVTTPAKDAAAAVARLSVAIADINDWMKASRLSLNLSKTQVMWLAPNSSLTRSSSKTFRCCPLSYQSSTRRGISASILIDSQLSMDVHVAAVCRSGYISYDNSVSWRDLSQPLLPRQ